MKIATEVALQAPPEKIWKTLTDFAAYPDWNRMMKSVRGQAGPDAALEVDLQYYGKPMKKQAGVISGFIPPKYFSWIWRHKFGAWFLACEHVFRIKQREDGKVLFYQEAYYTGLGLKFRRRDVEHMVRLTLDKLNDDLKHRLSEDGAAGPQG